MQTTILALTKTRVTFSLARRPRSLHQTLNTKHRLQLTFFDHSSPHDIQCVPYCTAQRRTCHIVVDPTEAEGRLIRPPRPWAVLNIEVAITPSKANINTNIHSVHIIKGSIKVTSEMLVTNMTSVLQIHMTVEISTKNIPTRTMRTMTNQIDTTRRTIPVDAILKNQPILNMVHVHRLPIHLIRLDQTPHI